jgi:hypothetical protein
MASVDVRPAHYVDSTSALTNSLDKFSVDDDEVVAARTLCVGEGEQDDEPTELYVDLNSVYHRVR